MQPTSRLFQFLILLVPLALSPVLGIVRVEYRRLVRILFLCFVPRLQLLFISAKARHRRLHPLTKRLNCVKVQAILLNFRIFGRTNQFFVAAAGCWTLICTVIIFECIIFKPIRCHITPLR